MTTVPGRAARPGPRTPAPARPVRHLPTPMLDKGVQRVLRALSRRGRTRKRGTSTDEVSRALRRYALAVVWARPASPRRSSQAPSTPPPSPRPAAPARESTRLRGDSHTAAPVPTRPPPPWSTVGAPGALRTLAFTPYVVPGERRHRVSSLDSAPGDRFAPCPRPGPTGTSRSANPRRASR